MSYTGFFAEEDLYEVAKDGDSSKGSWVVPIERSHDIARKDFVTEQDEITGEDKPVIHRHGTFVYRLAGRERQQSASYYTPEVLTRFTVSQALAELLDQDGHTTTAEEILNLTICEPALGSGAFAIEAVRQLAEQYLRRRKTETGKRIDPEQYPQELQRVKAYIALHQVYGVDLNDTAVEFAEITLWLDTMVSGLQAPWFGLRLRRGNSLIGARRAVYTRQQVNDKNWLTGTPTDVPMTGMVEEMAAGTTARQTNGHIHHFLLPAKGWGSAVEVKEAKEALALAAESVAALKKWRSAITAKPSKKQVDQLVELAHRVEALWQITLRRLEIAESEARRHIKLWERDEPEHDQAVTREQIEEALGKRNGAYQRLRRVMDAWLALWFWPLTDTDGAVPPTLEQWIDACQQLLGREPEARKNSRGMTPLGEGTNWDDLNAAEDLNLDFSGAVDTDEVLRKHPWLKVCESVSAQQGFFHWELDFATVFARGGFDLQLGNPPWVKLQTDANALLAEGDPWWQLTVKPDEEDRDKKRAITLALPGIQELFISGITDVVAAVEYLGSVQAYPLLAGLQPDLYRCFMERTWDHSSPTGQVALIHLDSHFTDEKAGYFREQVYRRLRRHWQFINELKLYDIQHQKQYGVNIYGDLDEVNFLTAASLYHPDTVERSLKHDGSGEEPGIKDPDGNWDLRPHSSRISHVTDATLRSWHAIMEDDSIPVRQSKMVYAINTASVEVLETLSRHPRIAAMDLQISRGWDESRDYRRGYFETSWGRPDSWNDVILQGSHLYVATPIYKTPNASMKHNTDWSMDDFETMSENYIPVTSYKPSGSRSRYDAAYSQWNNVPARSCYRIAWRRMAANTGERTLIPAIIPLGAAHVESVASGGFAVGGESKLCLLSGFLGSLISDFSVRSAPKGDIRAPVIERLPVAIDHPLWPFISLRSLRLNCLSDAFAELWLRSYRMEFVKDEWVGGYARRNRHGLGEVAPKWSRNSPLRIAEDRRQALLEIDTLVALMLGVSAEQLCTIYRTQFAVLYGYDHNSYVYDENGRLVPNEVLSVWRKQGDAITAAERTATNQAGNTYTYELPFRLLDREADMRQAYAEFERRLAVIEGRDQ
jgi:methylase of polypeptide subunit release factors